MSPLLAVLTGIGRNEITTLNASSDVKKIPNFIEFGVFALDGGADTPRRFEGGVDLIGGIGDRGRRKNTRI